MLRTPGRTSQSRNRQVKKYFSKQTISPIPTIIYFFAQVLTIDSAELSSLLNFNTDAEEEGGATTDAEGGSSSRPGSRTVSRQTSRDEVDDRLGDLGTNLNFNKRGFFFSH